VLSDNLEESEGDAEEVSDDSDELVDDDEISDESAELEDDEDEVSDELVDDENNFLLREVSPVTAGVGLFSSGEVVLPGVVDNVRPAVRRIPGPVPFVVLFGAVFCVYSWSPESDVKGHDVFHHCGSV
jgi:hypothetical protein